MRTEIEKDKKPELKVEGGCKQQRYHRDVLDRFFNGKQTVKAVDHRDFALPAAGRLRFITEIGAVPVGKGEGRIAFVDIIDSKGVLNIFNNCAILHYKGKEITLEKGEFSVSYGKVHFGRNGICNFLYPVVYVIKTKNKKFKIYKSVQEAYELTTFKQRMKKLCPELSLDIAMNALIKLSNTKNKKIKNEISYIGNIEIVLNISTLDVFENTDYFVDIENAFALKDVPFITCDIYENKNSNHLIGEIALLDDEKNDKLPSVEELKKRVIVSVIKLDEYIKK